VRLFIAAVACPCSLVVHRVDTAGSGVLTEVCTETTFDRTAGTFPSGDAVLRVAQ
jgi:hypothetical protein